MEFGGFVFGHPSDPFNSSIRWVISIVEKRLNKSAHCTKLHSYIADIAIWSVVLEVLQCA